MSKKPERPTAVVIEGPRHKFKAALDDLHERMPYMLEFAEFQAKMRRHAYLAYRAKGFTSAQALELCKEH